MKIEVIRTEDGYECETCGYNYAEGGSVYIDGELVLTKKPHAHCYNGKSYSSTELLILALEKMGHTILEDGNPFYIMSADARNENE